MIGRNGLTRNWSVCTIEPSVERGSGGRFPENRNVDCEAACQDG